MANGFGMGFSLQIDTRETEAAIRTMEDTSAELMAEAIFNVLKRQIPKSQAQIKKDAPVRQQAMALKVANSLVVEIGRNHNQMAEVRFGSDPIDEGGVSGSRGGKLAQFLEYGTPKFDYPFTFKTINNSLTFGAGEGFINAKTGNNTVHPGFKSIDWLSKARDGAVPEIEAAIVEAFNENWGGGGGLGNSQY